MKEKFIRQINNYIEETEENGYEIVGIEVCSEIYELLVADKFDFFIVNCNRDIPVYENGSLDTLFELEIED